jgi:poly(A) polymerase
MLQINRYVLNLFLRISKVASRNKQEAYLVGGFIRDYLLNRETNDIDIAVTGDSLGISKQVADLIKGNYFVLDRDNRVSRIEVNINRRQYHIDFSAIEGGILNDLGRRDFTINAMAVNLKDFDKLISGIIDPYKGKNDLGKKQVVAVNERIFEQDPSRLLRAIRLMATLNFKINRSTENLIKNNKYLTADIPGEHMRLELLKLLAFPGSAGWLRYLDKLGLLTGIIPEIENLKNITQPKEHHWDVYNHTLESVATTELLLRESNWRYNTGNLLRGTLWSRAISSHFNKYISVDCKRKHLLKIAALLHDIAKPATKQIDSSGRMRFLGHPKLGSEMSEVILQRLRFSNKEIKIVKNLVYNHLRPAQMSNIGLPTSRAIYRFFRDADGSGIDIIFLALADFLATRGPEVDIQEWKSHNHLMKYIVKEHSKQKTEASAKRIVNGYDLMNIFGLTPGPVVGQLLTELDEAQAAGEFDNKKEALIYIERLLNKKIY